MIIIGHRGAARHFPENTLPSFESAFKVTRSVEFDLWLSKDNIPFVFHDSKLDRTANGSGFATSRSLAELQKFDAGFHFDPKQDKSFPFRGQGIKIPSFEDLLKSFPGKHWCVEIKQNSADLVHQSVKLLKKYDSLGDCVIGSKYHRISETMQKFYPELPRFFSKRDMVMNFLDFKKGGTPKADPSGVASMPVRVQCGMDFTSAAFIQYLHAKKVTVYFWTVNDEKTMLRLKQNGADGIITDDPVFAAGVLR